MATRECAIEPTDLGKLSGAEELAYKGMDIVFSVGFESKGFDKIGILQCTSVDINILKFLDGDFWQVLREVCRCP